MFSEFATKPGQTWTKERGVHYVNEGSGEVITNDIEKMPYPPTNPSMQTFDTGATRNKDDHKYDYEGFLSPHALERFGQYMHEHRVQADGSVRDSDNWQKGIPKTKYVKSLLRHTFDVWRLHRGGKPVNPDTGQLVTLDEALCGVIFNAQGLLHETVKPVST